MEKNQTTVSTFDETRHELSKYDIDLRNPKGIYGKKNTNHVLIVSTDKGGNFYITRASSNFTKDNIYVSPTNSYSVDSIVDLEQKLDGYSKLSHRATQRLKFVNKLK